MKKLSPSKFTDTLHCQADYMLNINDCKAFDDPALRYGFYYQDYINTFIKELKKKAIGYCEASVLNLKPREFGYAILCKNDAGKRGWFVVDESMFQKVCEA